MYRIPFLVDLHQVAHCRAYTSQPNAWIIYPWSLELTESPKYGMVTVKVRPSSLEYVVYIEAVRSLDFVDETVTCRVAYRVQNVRQCLRTRLDDHDVPHG